MSERTSYTPGTPCWVELGTPDIEAAAAFYGDLFGWEIPELPNSQQLGGYRRAKKGGKDVAGVAPLMQEGQPPAWTTYVSVADAEATVAKAREAGAPVHVEPMDVNGLGKMAFFGDPRLGFTGVWEPGTFPGAELVNEPGAFTWNELGTRDPAAAKGFYATVFGWDVDEQEMGPGATYVVWKAGGASVGGMFDLTGQAPDEVPAHWRTYFSVEDLDASLETLKGGGGSVVVDPMDTPVGRFAAVTDPWGALFALIQPSEETLENAP